MRNVPFITMLIVLVTMSACSSMRPVSEEEIEMEGIYIPSAYGQYEFEIVFEADSTLQPYTADLGGNHYRYKVERRQAPPDTIR